MPNPFDQFDENPFDQFKTSDLPKQDIIVPDDENPKIAMMRKRGLLAEMATRGILDKVFGIGKLATALVSGEVAKPIDAIMNRAEGQSVSDALLGDPGMRLGEAAIGGVDAATSMAANIPVMATAGAAGLGAMAYGASVDEASKQVKGILKAGEGLTAPKTPEGERVLAGVGEVIGPPAAAIGGVVQSVYDSLNEAHGPYAAIALETAVNAAVEVLMIGRGFKESKYALRRIMKNVDVDDLARGITPELEALLKKKGISKEEFLELAPKRPIEEAAMVAKFDEASVRYSKAEITRKPKQYRTEKELLATETAEAARFRVEKLEQSKDVKKSIEGVIDKEVTKEQMGTVGQEALTRRKKVQKKRIKRHYDKSAKAASKIDEIPLDTKGIKKSIPKADDFEEMLFSKKKTMKPLNEILMRYGLRPPTEAMVKAGVKPKTLSVQNWDKFRRRINEISKGDLTRQAEVTIAPIREALEKEIDTWLGSTTKLKGGNIVEVRPASSVTTFNDGVYKTTKTPAVDKRVGGKFETINIRKDIIDELKKGRNLARETFIEFDKAGAVGQLINTKPNSLQRIVEASKVYDTTIMGRPVEQTRAVMESLAKSGKNGKEAITAIQTSVLMDLIEAGFAGSKKINNIKTFDPIAFKKRINDIGYDKLETIFKNNKRGLQKIKNMDEVAEIMIPDIGTKPPPNIAVQIAERLGIIAISRKIPGAPFAWAFLKKSVIDPVKTTVNVSRSLDVKHAVKYQSMVSEHYPGLAAAMGISKTLERGKEDE